MDNSENKKEKTIKQIVGDIGEHLAAKYLISRHFVIKEKNYRKKWGELDIIAEKDGMLRFVEVKSVAITPPAPPLSLRGGLVWLFPWRISHETPYSSQEILPGKTNSDGVTRETPRLHSGQADHFPEENIHLWKQRRMARAIQTYLLEKRVLEDQEWQIDVIAVFLDFSQKYATIRHLEDVVFDIKIS